MYLFRIAGKDVIGMTKKIVSFFLCVLTVISCFAFSSAASDEKLRRAYAKLPQIIAEISGDCEKGDVDLAVLKGEKLSVSSVKSGKSVSKLVYMLIDISTSMSQSTLDTLKPSLISYAQSMRDDDRLVLMTFGSEIKTLLEGGESDSKISSTINSVRTNAQSTSFYAALNKVYDDAKKHDDYTRKFVIAVSDGADIEKGNSSQQEVIDNYKTHALPVYALCQASSKKEEADGFGYIARISGGEFETYSRDDSSAKFRKIKKMTEDVSVIEMKSKSKKSLGTAALELKVDGKKFDQDITVDAVTDNKAPEIKKIEYDKESNSFLISFSENVENADNIASFEVKKGNKICQIVSVEYANNESKLNMKDDIYSGKYTFSFKSIVDASDNMNKLKKTEYTESISAKPIIIKALIIIGICMIPVLFILAFYLMLLKLKKKKSVQKIKDIFITQVDEKSEERIHIVEPVGMHVKFYIESGSGRDHVIDYNLVGSMMVGRSDMCEINIDDNKLSRQHFAIEEVDGGLAVTDLETTNGTYINGVRVKSKTFLNSGDKIMAGYSTITVTYDRKNP